MGCGDLFLEGLNGFELSVVTTFKFDIFCSEASEGILLSLWYTFESFHGFVKHLIQWKLYAISCI